jgi:hypothetical protein
MVTSSDRNLRWLLSNSTYELRRGRASLRFYLTSKSKSSFSNKAWTKHMNKVYFVTFLNPLSGVCYVHHFWVEMKERITSVFRVKCILRDLSTGSLWSVKSSLALRFVTNTPSVSSKWPLGLADGIKSGRGSQMASIGTLVYPVKC